MISSSKKSFKRVLKYIIIFVLLFTLSSAVFTKIIYDATFTRYDPEETVDADNPELIVSSRELLSFESGENTLQGYYYPSEENEAVVVLAPGYRAGADDYLWQIKSLVESGFGVFAFDSTGSCKSEGDSSVGFPQELLDLRAALDFVELNKRFGYSELLLFGHSRGGYAVCCALLYEYDISAVVSVSGVNSAMEGVIEPATKYVGSIAYGNYLFLWLYQASIFGADTVNSNAADAINQSEVPVLLVHGSNDDQVSIDGGAVVSHLDEIERDGVDYIVCDDPGKDGHTDLLFDEDGRANEDLMQEIKEFYDRNI
ncbi:MAG: alpha/beta fold hydrolase [Clostridia bacterium]|nr:alpha/beta fold hydrolase [Clostridia bacterium]